MKRPAPHVLSPAQQRAAEYLNRIVNDWRGIDPLARGRASLEDLAQLISASGKGVSAVSVGKWLDGRFIPNERNARAIARAFGRPMDEVFLAFGHTPPLGFAAFVAEARRAAGKEHWSDRAALESRLTDLLAPQWSGPAGDAWWIGVAQQTVQDEGIDLHEKARRLAQLVDADRYLRQAARVEAQS